MWRQQRVQAIVTKVALQGHEADFLQYHVPPRVGQHFLFNPVASLHAGVGQLIRGYSRLEGTIGEGTMAFFLGEESAAVGDDQSEISGARLVDSREIDFVENAVAQREPHAALEVECSAHARFGTRSPAGFYSGPSRRITKVIAHKKSPQSSLPEDVELYSVLREAVEKRI